MTNNIVINLSYNGSNFFGFVKQPNKRTVQGEMEEILTEIYQKNITLTCASRTDRYVHAKDQYVLYQVRNNKIELENIKNMFNKKFDDIFIKNIWIENDNHWNPRFSAIEKTYSYRLNLGEYDVLNKDIEFHVQESKKFDYDRLNRVIPMFIGEKDFQSFTAKTNYDSTIKTINNIYFEKLPNNRLVIIIIGPGFMRYMVRNIVGTIVEYVLGNIDIDYIEDLFNNPKKGKCVYKYPGKGLCLEKIKY